MIGTVCPFSQDAMIPNGKYDLYFDRKTGEVKKEEEPAKETEKEKNKTEEEQRGAQDAFKAYQLSRERYMILKNNIQYAMATIQQQARKFPNMLVSSYIARKINMTLREVRESYRDTGYLEMLDLIEEPHETETDGNTDVVGMSYSEAEVLIQSYLSVMYHREAVGYMATGA